MRARLTVEAGECLPPVFDLTPDFPATLGRGRDNTFVLRDVLASRLHAKVYFEDGHWHVRDFGLNGTRLEGHRVAGGAELADGLRIKIGEVVLRFTTPANGIHSPPAPIAAPPTEPIRRRPSSESHQTKLHELPASRKQPADPPPDVSANERRVDELTALCKFMATAVETKTPHDLIAVALRTILHQTTARLAGYLSFDPDDPTPKIVLPEAAAVDAPLSRRLTQQAFQTGSTVWLFPELTAAHAPTDSLTSLSDALCIPLKASGESFAALHVYRTGSAFLERDVRFIEAVAGFLAHGLEIHRNRRTLEAENSRLRTHAPAADEIIGESSPITHLRQQIFRAAPQSLTILVQGESGSGKELVALAIHRNSRRASGPLVVVNCAAITPSTLDAELFGYSKGAFGGADADQPGRFQQADEGTLFLDEVSELSLECQSKLLRVIEGKAYRPIGAKQDVKSDVRIVAATQRDLEAEVAAGRFRPDLYFRLKVIQIRVPALREHPEDIPELAGFFLGKVSTECRRNFRLAPLALIKLQSYAWPGNVRQLRAVIESAAVMSESDTLDAEAIPLVGSEVPANGKMVPAFDLPPSLDMDEIETWAIHRALRQTGGNVSHSAKLLGMSRDTLHTKIKKKGIDRDALANTPMPAVTGTDGSTMC